MSNIKKKHKKSSKMCRAHIQIIYLYIYMSVCVYVCSNQLIICD